MRLPPLHVDSGWVDPNPVRKLKRNDKFLTLPGLKPGLLFHSSDSDSYHVRYRGSAIIVATLLKIRCLHIISYNVKYGNFESGLRISHSLSWAAVAASWNGRSGDRNSVETTVFITVQSAPGAHPASYTMGTASFPGVKRPGCDVNHPPPPTPEVKKRV